MKVSFSVVFIIIIIIIIILALEQIAGLSLKTFVIFPVYHSIDLVCWLG